MKERGSRESSSANPPFTPHAEALFKRATDLPQGEALMFDLRWHETCEDLGGMLDMLYDVCGSLGPKPEFILRELMAWRQPPGTVEHLSERRTGERFRRLRGVIGQALRTGDAMFLTRKQRKGKKDRLRTQYLRDAVIIILWNAGATQARILKWVEPYAWPTQDQHEERVRAVRQRVEYLREQVPRLVAPVEWHRGRARDFKDRFAQGAERSLISSLGGLLTEV